MAVKKNKNDMVVTRPGYGGSSRQKPPRMVITASSTGSRITVYRSPREVSHSGIGQNWQESARVGRQAVLRRSSQKLPSYSFELTLGHQDWYREIGSELGRFIGFANSKMPVNVTYSKVESGLYYITEFDYTVILRSPFTNEPTRATVSVTFTKANLATVKTGPISKAKLPAKPGTSKAKASRKHKVVKGDTLSKIAQKYYGNSNKWPRIADANKIKNVRLLQIGKVLTIPAL